MDGFTTLAIPEIPGEPEATAAYRDHSYPRALNRIFLPCCLLLGSPTTADDQLGRKLFKGTQFGRHSYGRRPSSRERKCRLSSRAYWCVPTGDACGAVGSAIR